MNLQLKYTAKDFVQWLALIGAFAERWYELAILILINIIIVSRQGRLSIPKGIFFVLALILVYSLLSITVVGYSYNKLIQQIILIVLYITGYYNFFNFIDRDVSSLFRKYLKVAYIIAVIGLLQFAVYAVSGFNITGFLYGKPTMEIAPHILRVCSVLDEPSNFSTLMTPAITWFLLKKGSEKGDLRRKIVLFCSVFLTFSGITFLIVILILAYKYLFYIEKIWIRVAAVILLIIGLFNLPVLDTTATSEKENGLFSDIGMKLTDTFGAFSELDPMAFEQLNLSSYATMTNFWVALNAPMRLTGTGLGTHVQNYTSLYQSDFYNYGLNSEDGYSLANRIFSEFGILGLLMVIILMLRNFNKNNLINIAVAFILLSLLIRGGNYIRYGLIMYIFIYYYSNKNSSGKWTIKERS